MEAHLIKEKIKRIEKEIGNPMEVFSSLVRSMIIPTPGKEFFCSDFAAVEARLAFWLSGHLEGVKAFRDDRKLYEEMASDVFNIPLKDIGKDSLERFIGKTALLGAQYGCGPDKFLTQCHALGRKEVTKEIAAKAIKAYRNKHHPIPTAWKKLEQTAIAAIQNPGERYLACKCYFTFDGEFLRIKLPSGREMFYSQPHVVNKRDDYGNMRPEIRYYAWDWGINPDTGKPKKMWTRVHIWGGVFLNHITQGVARELMVNAIKNIESAGYDVCISIHDECLAERKIGEGDLKKFIALMTKLPEWANGAPITASGFTAMRYKK